MLTYPDRISSMRETKRLHTLQKREQRGYSDEDDYGNIPVPEDFRFAPEPGGIYGYGGLSKAFAGMLDRYPVYVDPMEMLCGRWSKLLTDYRIGARWDEARFPYDDLKPLQKLYNITSGIDNEAHCTPDFAIGLALGFGGLLEKVRKHREMHPERREYYDAEERVLLAVQKWIGRHIERIRGLLEREERPEIRESLAEMLAANEHIVDRAPETFLEACQWIAHFASASRAYNRDGAGCQLDAMLTPYYERDVAAGRLDDEKAAFILANLLLIDTRYYQLSGVDERGRDRTCRLSYLILEAAHLLNGSANLTVRVHKDIPEDFLRTAVSYLFNDRNAWPRFCGDEALVRGYMKNRGVDLATARNRIASGCNWMCVPGREYPMNDTVKINVARVFEVAFHDMTDAEPSPSTALLMDYFKKHLSIAVDVAARGANLHIDHAHEVQPELMLNLLTHESVESGLDVSQCAELYTVGVDGAGLAVAADSFAAIEQRVEREGRLSWEAVHGALHSDFAGIDGERTRLMLSSSERYCQGGSLGDKWARAITDAFVELVHNHPMPEGRQLVPGWFSWSRTILYGEAVGATPNGRRARAPISHGANPVPGFRRDGAVTAQSSGIAAVQPGCGNAAPLQLEFDPKLSLEEGGADRVLQLIRKHFELGGTLININVLDQEVLLAANENPDLFPELVVRVTGFTAYFASLSPKFRQLVVDRFLSGF
ncbi:MAG: formate acetyltransferase [Clostridiales bacterium]|nr:formate acetyltransferase [Clostridiales bacterium]